MITAMQWTSSSPCPCTACISMSLVAVFVTWELWSLSCRWRPPTVLKYSPCSAVKKLDSLEYKWTLFLTVDLGVISLSLDSVIWVNGEQREEIQFLSFTLCPFLFFSSDPCPVLHQKALSLAGISEILLTCALCLCRWSGSLRKINDLRVTHTNFESKQCLNMSR